MLAGIEASETTHLETFDDLDSPQFEEEVNDIDDNWDVPDKEEKKATKEKVSEDLKPLKDSEADLEGKVIKKDEKKDKKEEDDEDEEEEVKEEVKEEKEKEEETSEEKKESKKLRLKMNGELFNVDSEATVKVKVDGEAVEVPIRELINNYSGKTAWDKKFTEVGKEKKQVEYMRTKLDEDSERILSVVNKAMLPLKDPNANPLDSLLHLVEFSGEDPYNAFRRIMEANLEEVQTLLEMDTDAERELYFHKKKDELQSKVFKSKEEARKQEATFNQELARVEELRKTFGISEDQFVEAADELEEMVRDNGMDVKKITNEKIVQFASLRPHISKVTEMLEPVKDNIADSKYGDIVRDLATYLRDGELSEKQLKDLIKKNFSVDEEVKELNTRVYAKHESTKRKNVEQTSDELETFDDIL